MGCLSLAGMNMSRDHVLVFLEIYWGLNLRPFGVQIWIDREDGTTGFVFMQVYREVLSVIYI